MWTEHLVYPNKLLQRIQLESASAPGFSPHVPEVLQRQSDPEYELKEETLCDCIQPIFWGASHTKRRDKRKMCHTILLVQSRNKPASGYNKSIQEEIVTTPRKGKRRPSFDSLSGILNVQRISSWFRRGTTKNICRTTSWTLIPFTDPLSHGCD